MGAGGFCQVWRAIHSGPKATVAALKIAPACKYSVFKNEKTAFDYLKGKEEMVQLLESCKCVTIEGQQLNYMALEYCPHGTLMDLMTINTQTNWSLSEDMIRQVFG